MVADNRNSRVQLKPHRGLSEHLDGAWWPRSQNLVDELPDLVTSVSDRLGQVVMVGYRRNGWDQTPPLTEIAGRTIRLLVFISNEPTSVILIGEDGRHLTLHVIRPDTDEQTARKLLTETQVPADTDVAPASRSTVSRSVAEVADKLARHEGLGDEQRTAQIKGWCDEVAQQFVNAPVQTFVQILVEHIVHNRMIESRRKASASG